MWRKSVFWPSSRIIRTKFQRIYLIICSANLLKAHKKRKKSQSLRSKTTFMEEANGTCQWRGKPKTSRLILLWRTLFPIRSQTTTFWAIPSGFCIKTSSTTKTATNPKRKLYNNHSQSQSMYFHCWGWSLQESIWLRRSSAKSIISLW